MKNKQKIILDTALILFRDLGFQAVGVDKVVAEAGVAKMTLYKYYASKNALIEAVLLERDEQFQAALLAFVNEQKTPQNQLLAIFKWHKNWFCEKEFHGCMFINATVEFRNCDAPIQKVVLNHKLQIQKLFETILEQLLPLEQAQLLSIQLRQLLDGAIVTAQINNNPESANIAWQSALGLLKDFNIDLETKEL